MKEGLKAYFSFNKSERRGLVALLSILFLLIVVRVSMHWFVPPPVQTQHEQKLTQAWEQFKRSHVADSIDHHQPNIIRQATEKPTAPAVPIPQIKKTEQAKLFSFDPNTIDSAGLRRLGLREKTTSIFLHWRAKGKIFYKKEELRKVYTLTEEEYLRLEPYIVIGSDDK